MPLTDEEWVASINETNDMVDNVGRHFGVLLEALDELRRRTPEVRERGDLEPLLRRFIVLASAQAQRIRERLNSFLRRLNDLRELGEL